jgi:hypothetical protein
MLIFYSYLENKFERQNILFVYMDKNIRLNFFYLNIEKRNHEIKLK